MSLQEKLKRVLELTKQNIEKNEEQCGETSSKFFRTDSSTRCENITSIPELFLGIIARMNVQLRDIQFPSPIAYIYNPTEYAVEPLFMYLKRYCVGNKHIMFLGMNPGPFGMCQTGVPFGEVTITRDWLQIHGTVNKPLRESEARPINGFSCSRSEVSGKRFWGLFKEICGTPDNFFKYGFCHNYCPLAFMNKDGKNITPTEIKGLPSKRLTEICDHALLEVIQLLQVKILVGVGRYAENRASLLLKGNLDIQVLYLPHPSPRVVGSEHWHENSLKDLYKLDLMKYFNGGGS